MWEMVWVVIPLTVIIGNFVSKIYRIRVESQKAANDDQVYRALTETVRRLDARVANLERAVTTTETERKFSL